MSSTPLSHPGIPPTCFLGLTIFCEDEGEEQRLVYRPELTPDMKVADLTQEAYRIILESIDVDRHSYEAQELYVKELIKQADSTHVLVRLEGPTGVYIRRLEEFETDSALWEAVLNYEFPDRVKLIAEGVRPERRPGLVSEPWWPSRNSVDVNRNYRRDIRTRSETVTAAFKGLGIAGRKERAITEAFMCLRIEE